MTQASSALVIGYLPHLDAQNPRARALKLNERFAFVLDTYNPENEEMTFNARLSASLIAAVLEELKFDRAVADEHSKYSRKITSVLEINHLFLEASEGKTEPFRRLSVFKNDVICGYAETLFFNSCGGPDPYHDSYTTEFYVKNLEEKWLTESFEKICRTQNTKIRGIYSGNHEPKLTLRDRISKLF